MDSLSTSSRSGRMHVQAWGQGSVTWVLVHGWLVTGDVFAPLCRNLILDAQILVPDLAGTGRSRPTNADVGMQSWTTDVVGLLSECAGPVHLLGHSMGGLLAQLVAAAYPDLVASLTLLLPVPISGLHLKEETMALFEAAGANVSTRRAVLDVSCGNLTDEQRIVLHRMASDLEQSAVDNGLRGWLAGSPNTDLRRISCPTQVIGTGDSFLTDELLEKEVACKIPRARFVKMSDAGHYPQVAATAELARIIEGFAGIHQ